MASEENRFFYNMLGGLNRMWQLVLVMSGVTYALKRDVIYKNNRQMGFYITSGLTLLINFVMTMG